MVDKNRPHAGRRAGAGGAARARAGAARAAGLRAASRDPDGAALPGARPTGMDACIARRPELRRFNRTRDQVPHECARPDRRSTGKRTAAVLRATAARARGLAGGGGPLLVIRWQRRKPGQGTTRPRIPEAASGCRGRVLAAGQGKRLARAGGRRTRLERRSEMAPRRAALSRSEGAAGDGSRGRAQAARDAREPRDRAQDLWLRSRAL